LAFAGPVALFATPLWCPGSFTQTGELALLLADARRLEKAGEWGAAAGKYEELLRRDRNQAEAREHLQYVLRRYFQVVRLRDPSYHRDVLSLKYPQAMHLYEIVLFNLLNGALDRDKVSAGALFRKGVEEFRNALSGPEFCSDQLGGIKPDRTRSLQNLLQQIHAHKHTMTYEEAVESVRDVVMTATNHFPNINPTAVVMEFLCGACVAMDEYTVYLTPRQLRELCDTLKGSYVGIGIRLKLEDNKVLIAEVLPESPATEVSPPLTRNDHIVRVGDKITESLSPEAVADLLEGDAGTAVELWVASPTVGLRFVTIRRRACFLPSVQHDIMGNVGYLKIHCFQKTTVQEFEAHLTELLKADCKALILDIRGNPGGLLDVSIEIAKRFLPEGVIVRMQHQDPKASTTYRSTNPMALTLPLVVMVDGDTASAAEVLAGALKENHRARLIGQTTFGKGCSQGLLELPGAGALRSPATPSATGGTGAIRITIARFFSPSDQPYSGRGVEPDIPAEGIMQVYQARDEAIRLMGMHDME
jgi:carboxyl-terminal processing protease